MPKQPNGDYLPDFVETYCVGAGAVAPEGHQHCSVFLPDAAVWPKPPAGYPIVVLNSYGHFITAPHATIIPAAAGVLGLLFYRLLDELGVAIGWYGVTGAWSAEGGVLNITSNGRGLFHQPGTAGWNDDTRYSGYKEAILAAQLIRHHAKAIGIDASRMIFDGQSTGSSVAAAPAFWADQADGSKADHRAASSRILGVRMRIGQADWSLYDPTLGSPNTDNFTCWPRAAGDITQDIAHKYEDADDEVLRWASPVRIGLDRAAARARNARGVYVWLACQNGGRNIDDFSLAGEWTATSGKRFGTLDTLDPLAGGAKHEAVQMVSLMRALREIEHDAWHTSHSRLSLGKPEFDYVAAADPVAAALVDYVMVQPISETALVQLEMDWFAFAFAGGHATSVSVKAPSIALGEVLDVALVLEAGGASFDLALDGGDLGREQGLRTALVCSLFSDAAADIEDLEPGEDGRGWWAQGEDGFGSLLWRLGRRSITSETVELARRGVESALAWLVREQIARGVTVRAERARGRADRIDVEVHIERSDSSRWASAWAALAGELAASGSVRVTLVT